MRFQIREINWKESGAEIVAAAEAQFLALAGQGRSGSADFKAKTLNTGWPFGGLEKADQIVNV
ncbi:MAG: hypothetical protein KGK02_07945 [Rhodospirillales bacterium]|nr:hypothetical protein [Rhodospirillales bacterium]